MTNQIVRKYGSRVFIPAADRTALSVQPLTRGSVAGSKWYFSSPLFPDPPAKRMQVSVFPGLRRPEFEADL
jgi:hypothetical protein